MSQALLKIAQEFVDNDITPGLFVDRFTELWREERDSGISMKDDELLSEKLSTIFCLADLYNPGEEREVYEYDERRLRSEVRSVLQR